MQDSFKRRVKIVCTLGPSTRDPEKIRDLILAGMDVARLNFSHGDHSFHRETYQTVRDQASALNRNVAIIQDLQGPKIRLGKLPSSGVTLKPGEEVLLYPEGSKIQGNTEGKVPLPISAEIAEGIARDVKPGAWIVFDDGKVGSVVKSVSSPEIVVEVKHGGHLTSNKGMNLPGTPLSIACCTEKDLEDLKFGLELGVDAVALSFVRSAQDIEFVKKKIKKHTSEPPLVFAKMEREEAIVESEAIIEVSDGILIARGDMATELGAEKVPLIQKQLITTCNQLGVPVITATQMLESMIKERTPTRAEASDVANAVFDGTDAVMLSGETASGNYPIEAVQTMSKIILEAEGSIEEFGRKNSILPMTGAIVESVQFSASRIAQHVGAACIACVTRSGRAAKILTQYRPSSPIVAIMDESTLLPRLSFFWGVNGILVSKIGSTDDVFATVEEVLLKNQIVESGDLVVITAGVPTLRRGTTNMVKVHKIGASIEKGEKSEVLQ